MDIQEMLHRLLAKMDENQAKSDAARKADRKGGLLGSYAASDQLASKKERRREFDSS
jgi:hypothetical protein